MPTLVDIWFLNFGYASLGSPTTQFPYFGEGPPRENGKSSSLSKGPLTFYAETFVYCIKFAFRLSMMFCSMVLIGELRPIDWFYEL